MSLLYFDGIDSYDTATMDRRWQTVSGVTVSAAVKRTGAGSLYLNAATDYAIALNPKNDPVTISEIKIGFAFRYALGAIGSIVSVWDWTACQCYLVLDDTGHIDMHRGDGTKLDDGVKVLAENTWYYIEWYVSIANVGAAWTLKIDEAQDFAEVTGDTQEAPTDAIVYVRFGDVGNSTHDGLYDFYVDDFYLVDPTDATWPDEFLGDVRVDLLTPTGDGTYTDGDLVGQATGFECWDEAPPNDLTDYVRFDGTGDARTVTVDPMTFKPSKIFGVQVLACNQAANATESLAPGLVSGSGYDLTHGVACSLEWGYAVRLDPLDPDASTTWSVAAVAAAEYGAARDT